MGALASSRPSAVGSGKFFLHGRPNIVESLIGVRNFDPLTIHVDPAHLPANQIGDLAVDFEGCVIIVYEDLPDLASFHAADIADFADKSSRLELMTFSDIDTQFNHCSIAVEATVSKSAALAKIVRNVEFLVIFVLFQDFSAE